MNWVDVPLSIIIPTAKRRINIRRCNGEWIRARPHFHSAKDEVDSHWLAGLEGYYIQDIISCAYTRMHA